MEPTTPLPPLLACITNDWSPTIGDPTVMGWVTVAAYFITAFTCAWTGRVRIREKRFWYFLFVVLLFLAVNKQLDLQSAITATGRCHARLEGWYGDRRAIQFYFILGVLGVSALVFLYALSRLFFSLGRVGIALLGFGVLLSFIGVRAVGFHDFDTLIGTTVLGTRVNVWMELGGIGLILLNAIFSIRGRPRRKSLSEREGSRPSSSVRP